MNAPTPLRTRAIEALLLDLRDGGNRVAVLREIQRSAAA